MEPKSRKSKNIRPLPASSRGGGNLSRFEEGAAPVRMNEAFALIDGGDHSADGTPKAMAGLKYQVSCYSFEIGVVNFLKTGGGANTTTHISYRQGVTLLRRYCSWLKRSKVKSEYNFPNGHCSHSSLLYWAHCQAFTIVSSIFTFVL